MLFSNFVMYFIILTTAATLNAHGRLTNIETARQAAEACGRSPATALTGCSRWASLVPDCWAFRCSPVPVLTPSPKPWRGVARSFRTANSRPGFYTVLAISWLSALALVMPAFTAVKMLFWSAVPNGVLAPPLIVIVLLLTSRCQGDGDAGESHAKYGRAGLDYRSGDDGGKCRDVCDVVMKMNIKTILVPIVFADTSRHALQEAAWLARRFQAEMILLHVVTPFNYPAGMLEGGHEITARDLHAHIVQQSQKELDETLRTELEGIAVTRILLRGDAAEEIVKTARSRNVELIVMSTRGHGAFYRYLLGSVTAKDTARKPLSGLDRRSP